MLGLQEDIAPTLITVNVDSVHEFTTVNEGTNQSSNHMLNGPEITNFNVTHQNSIINGPERRVQTKIDVLESNVINHVSFAPNDIQSDQRFKAQILSKCPVLFHGKIGLMKGEVFITLKDDARPYEEPITKVAHAMEKPLKDELDRLGCEGILVKMDPDEPRDRLNSFISVQKPNGKIRLCLDLTKLNKYMVRPRHNAQILDALFLSLAGVRHFMIIDCLSSFFIYLTQRSVFSLNRTKFC